MAVHALAQLIEDVQNMADPRLSLGEIARRSGLSSSRVHQLVRGEMKSMPDPATLRSLADALRVPLRVVVDAALVSLGLPAGTASQSQGTVEQLRTAVASSTVMTAEERGYWNAMVDALEARIERDKGRPRPVSTGDQAAAALEAMSRPTSGIASRRAALDLLADKVQRDTRLSAEQRVEWTGWVTTMREKLDAEEANAEHNAL